MLDPENMDYGSATLHYGTLKGGGGGIGQNEFIISFFILFLDQDTLPVAKKSLPPLTHLDPTSWLDDTVNTMVLIFKRRVCWFSKSCFVRSLRKIATMRQPPCSRL